MPVSAPVTKMISVPLTETTCCPMPPRVTATGSSKPLPKMVTRVLPVKGPVPGPMAVMRIVEP